MVSRGPEKIPVKEVLLCQHLDVSAQSWVSSVTGANTRDSEEPLVSPAHFPSNQNIRLRVKESGRIAAFRSSVSRGKSWHGGTESKLKRMCANERNVKSTRKREPACYHGGYPDRRFPLKSNTRSVSDPNLMGSSQQSHGSTSSSGKTRDEELCQARRVFKAQNDQAERWRYQATKEAVRNPSPVRPSRMGINLPRILTDPTPMTTLDLGYEQAAPSARPMDKPPAMGTKKTWQVQGVVLEDMEVLASDRIPTPGIRRASSHVANMRQASCDNSASRPVCPFTDLPFGSKDRLDSIPKPAMRQESELTGSHDRVARRSPSDSLRKSRIRTSYYAAMPTLGLKGGPSLDSAAVGQRTCESLLKPTSHDISGADKSIFRSPTRQQVRRTRRAVGTNALHRSPPQQAHGQRLGAVVSAPVQPRRRSQPIKEEVPWNNDEHSTSQRQSDDTFALSRQRSDPQHAPPQQPRRRASVSGTSVISDITDAASVDDSLPTWSDFIDELTADVDLYERWNRSWSHPTDP